MERLKIFGGNSNPLLTNSLCRNLCEPLSKGVVKRFSDGEIMVELHESMRGMHVFVIQSTSDPVNVNLMELLIIIDALKRASAAEITAVIPYYGYARQDRKDRPRVAITAKLVANLITTAGVDRIITMDLHASQLQGFFDLPHDHLYSSVIFNKYIRELNLKDLCVVSPDVGSIKLARATASALNGSLAIVDKRRPEANVSKVMNLIGDVKDKNILIRDDMVDTGGSICHAAEFLMESGAKDIYSACTHGVLSGDAINKINNSPIKKMLISDSIDQSQRNLSDKFEILTCSGLIGEAIQRIFDEESVSSLFEDQPQII